MTAALGSMARPAFNILFNAGAGYCISKQFDPATRSYDLAVVLAIDTALRIIASHALSAFYQSVRETAQMGHLLFLGATLLIQPCSVYLARRFFAAQAPRYIHLGGYIALSWKLNMIVKHFALICRPQKRA
jgi:hypothetical protein